MNSQRHVTDSGAQHGVGTAMSRPEGPLKVTGQAKYAADNIVPDALHAVLVPATIASGRVTRIETRAASSAPGVVSVLTHVNTPRLRAVPETPGFKFWLLQDDVVHYEGQPVAVVVARTLEQAEHAATLVRVNYERRRHAMFGEGEELSLPGLIPADFEHGDFTRGMAAAESRVEQSYTLSVRHHFTMEPSATVVVPDGDRLTVYDATQAAFDVARVVSTAFGLPLANVRVICPFTGGGFGCKGWVWPHVVLAAAAARHLRRPVRLVLRRADTFTAHGYQPAMRQTVAVGATRDGTLTALRHDSTALTSVVGTFIEPGPSASHTMYKVPALRTRTRGERCNVGPPTAMRAPVEGPGLVALESAMDELAHALSMDPLELRLRNYAETEPMDGRRYSSKELRECYRRGAERFGWSGRSHEPRSMRDGRLLVGWGMASAIMDTFRFPASARVRLRSDGTAIVESCTQEIGTGNYAVLAQVAAEALGLDTSQVTVQLGDTTLPEAGPTTGSSSTMGVGSAVLVAAERLRERLLTLARSTMSGSPLASAAPVDIAARGGRLVLKSDMTKGVDIADVMRRGGVEEIVGEGKWGPAGDAPFDAGGKGSGLAMHSYGAVFVEVTVDEPLGLVRMRRCVGVYSAGRIINPKTARSQMTGGIIWGYGQAVLEGSDIDTRYGRFLSKNMAGTIVPVNADIPELDVSFVEEYDPHASLLGARGIGELGACGVAPAIANAVFHATGRRIRDFPLRIDRVMATA